jgi:hypothetical protein
MMAMRQREITLERRIARVICVSLLMGFSFPQLVGAQAPQTGATKPSHIGRALTDIGLIFNTDSLLLDLESYQAGVGVKMGWSDLCARVLLDLVANGSSGSYLIDAGTAIEYHLLPAPLSFYVGTSLTAGYRYQQDWLSSGHISLSGLSGVELFLTDFLSVFAEYAVRADFALSKDLNTHQTSFDFLVDTGMGNSSKIGIVIYFIRTAKKK